MKWAWGIGLALTATAWVSATVILKPVPQPNCRWGDIYAETGNDVGLILVTGWKTSSLPGDLERALEFLRKTSNGLIVYIAPCIGADSSCMDEVIGRLTPQKLSSGVYPAGEWQWDKPLVVVLKDSASCDRFLMLRERRWTEVVADTSMVSEQGAKILWGMVRRYKRERVDRMEEMFRK